MRPGFNLDDMDKWKSLLDWRWHKDQNMVSLWLHLLALADEQGVLVTSRKELSRATGISEQSIRTCLKRLVAENMVTNQSTNENSVITICYLIGYKGQKKSINQPINQPPTNLSTNQKSDLIGCGVVDYDMSKNTYQPTNQPTQCKERKEPKERNNNIYYPPPYSAHVRERLEFSTVQNSLWLDQTAMNLRITEVAQLASEVMDGWEISQIPEEEWTAYHLISGMRKLLQIRKTQTRPTKADEKAAWRAQMMQSIKNDLTNNGNPTQ